MRYANYKYKPKRNVNIGDYMQILAVDNVYSHMGIKKEDIVYIDTDKLSTYDGDYVVLPISLLLHNTSGLIKYDFSDKILPVFICYTTYLTKLHPEDVGFLTKHEPIGCRDLHAVNLLRKYGIRAYLNGCITALFPKCNIDRRGCDRVFIVDASDELLKAIPDRLKEGAELISHLMTPIDSNMKDYTKGIYERYKKEAALVITSRLHSAVPCIAAGIPVIFACDKYSSRLTWIDRVIPVYTLERYSQIDWNPEPVDFEEMKSLILFSVIRRLKDKFERFNDVFSISSYYEDVERPKYGIEGVSRAISKISGKWNRDDAFSYSIWGLTTFAQNIYDYLSEEFPNARLTHVYDKHRRTSFHGLITEDPDTIGADDNDFLFIALTASRSDGLEYLNRIGRSGDTYLFLCNPLDGALNIENW